MNSTASLIQLVRRTRPSGLLLSTLFVVTLMSSLLGLLVPLQTKALLDKLSETGMFTNEQALVLLAVLIGSAILTGVMTYIMGKIGNEQKTQVACRFI